MGLPLGDGKRGDINAARTPRLLAGAIIVAMDRACNDFKLFAAWRVQGVFFVTRKKDGTLYDVIESRSVVPGKNALTDETLVFSAPKSYYGL